MTEQRDNQLPGGAGTVATTSEGAAAVPKRDVALVHGVTPDGTGLCVIRQREDRIEIGAVKPLREGVPITGEVVTLRPRPEFPLLCDVEVQVEAPKAPAPREPAAALRKGPAQVASDEYRRN